jgi:Ca2+-binding RTX toxin-like protein
MRPNAPKLVKQRFVTRPAIFEPLELRRHLSASWWFGTLTVKGTSGSDVIDVRYAANGFTYGTQVYENGVRTYNSPIFVSRVIVDAMGGHDRVTIHPGVSRASLVGGDGNDTLVGGQNNDSLVGGMGADQLQGGGGIDTADYSARTDDLTITLDGLANDGATAAVLAFDPEIGTWIDTTISIERDNVLHDIENVLGGSGNDSISETSAFSTSANNTFVGNGGDDFLDGGGGNDMLDGGDGNDQFLGGNGNDSILGGADNDIMSGGRGIDTLMGGFGDDEIYAWGDAVNDIIDGGDGFDRARVDPGDVLASIEQLI